MSRMEPLYRSLLQITNILVRETTPEGLFKSLAKNLQPIVGFDRCSLSIYDQEGDSLSWFARAEGVHVTCMDSWQTPLRGPLARKAIATRAPVIIPDLREYAADKVIQEMIAAGLSSSMAFPLLSRDRAIGALVLSFIRPLSDEDKQTSLFLREISLQVSLAVENMLIHTEMTRRNESLHRQMGELLRMDDPQYADACFFYECATMKTLMGHIRLLAKSDAPVLVCGETGTGKECVARFIHRHSRRKSFNFVKVNCPALSPALFESELFGHAKGAFTGAIHGRMGRFELADKGSIFLDEVGELDVILQAKLLHVLQDAKLERVGESRPISVNVRCISATNADLQRMMHEGRFRRDLFYRMGVTSVHLPPLRDRKGEFVPMLRHLVRMLAEERKCAPPRVHPEAVSVLENYHWPGNVRELSNLVACMFILYPNAEVGPAEVRLLLEQSGSRIGMDTAAAETGERGGWETEEADSASAHSLVRVEAAHIEKVLALTGGKVSGPHGAAALLGIPRSTLQYKLHKHGITPKSYKPAKQRSP